MEKLSDQHDIVDETKENPEKIRQIEQRIANYNSILKTSYLRRKSLQKNISDVKGKDFADNIKWSIIDLIKHSEWSHFRDRLHWCYSHINDSLEESENLQLIHAFQEYLFSDDMAIYEWGVRKNYYFNNNWKGWEDESELIVDAVFYKNVNISTFPKLKEFLNVETVRNKEVPAFIVQEHSGLWTISGWWIIIHDTWEWDQRKKDVLKNEVIHAYYDAAMENNLSKDYYDRYMHLSKNNEVEIKIWDIGLHTTYHSIEELASDAFTIFESESMDWTKKILNDFFYNIVNYLRIGGIDFLDSLQSTPILSNESYTNVVLMNWDEPRYALKSLTLLHSLKKNYPDVFIWYISLVKSIFYGDINLSNSWSKWLYDDYRKFYNDLHQTTTFEDQDERSKAIYDGLIATVLNRVDLEKLNKDFVRTSQLANKEKNKLFPVFVD